jgi:hypothetical protein
VYFAGRADIHFWQAAVGCLAVIAVDVVFDETRVEDAVFFAGLAVVIVGIAVLARCVTMLVLRRRAGRTADRLAG